MFTHLNITLVAPAYTWAFFVEFNMESPGGEVIGPEMAQTHHFFAGEEF